MMQISTALLFATTSLLVLSYSEAAPVLDTIAGDVATPYGKLCMVDFHGYYMHNI